MNQIVVTRHARQRIAEGDSRHGLRTVLSEAEVIELARSPFVVKEGSTRYVYNPKDRKTLAIITRQLGRKIITVIDTRYHPNRLVDMLALKRAGEPFTFAPAQVTAELSEDAKTQVTLGTFRENRPGDLRAYDLVELGTFHQLDLEHPATVETKEFHQMLVEGTLAAWKAKQISRNAMRRLHAFFYSPQGDFGKLPLWVSFELLGVEYPIQQRSGASRRTFLVTLTTFSRSFPVRLFW